jgi:hypothetical protein
MAQLEVKSITIAAFMLTIEKENIVKKNPAKRADC